MNFSDELLAKFNLPSMNFEEIYADSDDDYVDLMMDGLKIGSDPELFIINTKTNKVVSSIGLIPGKKGQAWVDPSWKKGYGLETDNVLAEFNIPPATTCEEFVDSMEFMKNFIDKFVKSKNPDYGIMHKASAIVDDDQLQSDEAKEFGCSVDYNIYTEAPNPKPCGETTNVRSAGVHIHCSYAKRNQRKSIELLRYMDAYVGVPSVILDNEEDSVKRRTLYGKAGCFRLTGYGYEYRSLSGKFLANKLLEEFMFKATQHAVFAYAMKYEIPNGDIIQKCINNSDVELAKQLIKDYKLI